MIIYLGLGSNEGDRVGYIQQALKFLRFNKDITILSTSSFYETEPLGFPDQRWFVNAAVAIHTDLPPEAMLELCHEIEQTLGRKRDPENRNAPRTIDVDILMCEDRVIQTETLAVPHPRMHQRACVLVPMLEVNPRLKHPILGKSMENLHRELDCPELVFLYGTLPRDDDTLLQDLEFPE